MLLLCSQMVWICLWQGIAVLGDRGHLFNRYWLSACSVPNTFLGFGETVVNKVDKNLHSWSLHPFGGRQMIISSIYKMYGMVMAEEESSWQGIWTSCRALRTSAVPIRGSSGNCPVLLYCCSVSGEMHYWLFLSHLEMKDLLQQRVCFSLFKLFVFHI